jgi:serine/threonine-protein kinase
MAEVWSATNVLTGREFAIKLILPSLCRNSEAVERFFLEAEAAGRLRHPSIVDVFDVGRTNEGRPFLVMERLRGESLEQRLRERGRLRELETCVLVSQLARALSMAHEAGVVHRDLSTANVFLSSGSDGGEVPKILDFGVSKITDRGLGNRVRTGDGAVLGSPGYMSPEQACGAENVDHQSDVWSLGVLAYECLSGRTPFTALNYNALMLAIVTVPHRPLGELMREIDPELVGIVESCLVKDRAHRTRNALVLGEQLEAVARRLALGRRVAGPSRRATDRLPQSLPPPGARLWQLVGRRPVAGVVAGVTTTALGILVGVAIAGSEPKDSNPETRAARDVSAPAVLVQTPAPRAKSDPELDLVRATARGLGVLPKRKPKAKPVVKLALDTPVEAPLVGAPPRDNPY